MRNVSEATGRAAFVTAFTTLLRDGNLFYAIAVAPQDEYTFYEGPFQKVTRSIRIYD